MHVSFLDTTQRFINTNATIRLSHDCYNNGHVVQLLQLFSSRNLGA